MRSPLAYTIAAALVILALQRGNGVSARGMASNPDVAGGPASVVLRIPKEDALTPGHIAELRRGSAIARELFARVANMPNTILILRGAPALAARRTCTDEVGSGRTRRHFSVSSSTRCDGCTTMEQSASSSTNWRTRSKSAAPTGARDVGPPDLRALASHRDRSAMTDGSETEFPQQVALAVLLELLGKTAHSNTLEALAHDHGIKLPPADEGDSELSEVALQ